MTSPQKTRPGYTGNYDDQGQPHGHGVQKYQDGSRYEGDFDHGAIHGQGVYRYNSGATYVGFFEKGARAKHGTYTFACGTVYEGDYQHDKRSGQGSIVYSAASGAAIRDVITAPVVLNAIFDQTRVAKRYDGAFFNGKMHGNGTLLFTSGAVYRGVTSEDLEHGPGELTFNDGQSRIDGTFEHGLLSGRAVVTHAKSGEEIALVLERGTVVAQHCIFGQQGAQRCDFADDAQRQQQICSRCGATKRSELSDWLLPPPSPPSPAPSPVKAQASAPATPILPATLPAKVSNPSSKHSPTRITSARPRRGRSDVVAGMRSWSSTSSDSDNAAVDDPSKTPSRTSPSPPPQATVVPLGPRSDRRALELLTERVAAILREVKTGLGMAIAECVPHQPGPALPPTSAFGPDVNTSMQTAAAVTPTRLLRPGKVDVRVVQVAPNSPAAHSGFVRGDYLLAADGHAIRTTADFTSLVLVPGQHIQVRFRRRHPMSANPATNEAARGPGEVVERTVTVGCSLMQAELERLMTLQGIIAKALLSAADRPSVAEATAWTAEVDSIRNEPYPVSWEQTQAFDI
jgi:hypothetical protein